MKIFLHANTTTQVGLAHVRPVCGTPALRPGHTHTHGDEDDPSSEDELRTGTGYCSNRERLRDNTSADVLQ